MDALLFWGRPCFFFTAYPYTPIKSLLSVAFGRVRPQGCTLFFVLYKAVLSHLILQAQPSKYLCCTATCATFLLNAHLSEHQNCRAFLSERLRLLCQKIPDTLCSRPRNNYIRLSSALVHALSFQ